MVHLHSGRETAPAPQGSLLGALFFIILISDLPSVVLPCNTIALYVDDYKNSKTIDFDEDLELFQTRP